MFGQLSIRFVQFLIFSGSFYSSRFQIVNKRQKYHNHAIIAENHEEEAEVLKCRLLQPLHELLAQQTNYINRTKSLRPRTKLIFLNEIFTI